MGLNDTGLAQAVTLLRKSDFLGNVTKLLSGTVFAQMVGFAVIPILTRLYRPEAFGVLGVFVAVTEVASRISTFRYDVALVLPKEDRDAWSLLRFAGLLCLLVALLALAGAYPFRGVISQTLGSEALAFYFPLIALMMVGMGWQGLAVFWSTRKKHFKAIAQSSAGASLLGNGIKVLGGVLGFGAGGLLLGIVAQRWFQVLILRFTVPLKRELKQPRDRGEGFRQAKIYSEFPRYRMPQDALNSFTRQLPNVLLAGFFSPYAAGFYILATRVLEVPFAMLQDAVRKVFYVKAVEEERDGGSLFRLCSQMSAFIAVAMLPVALVIFLWGGVLFEWVFGSEWATTGSYAKWVMIFLLFNFSSLPFSVVIPVIGMNRFYLIFEMASMVFRVSVVVLVAMSWNVEATVASIAISSSLSSLFLILLVLRRLRLIEQSDRPEWFS